MILIWLVSLGCLVVWLAPMLELLIWGRKVGELSDVAVDGESLPRLSIVVPALNEASTVEQAMRTLLRLDYPDLEIIAINDRSTDATGEILERLSREDPRLQVLHIKELPTGWLGKNHAMQRGQERASGQYVLFTDADVHFEPSALRRAVRYCEQQRADHLVVASDVVMKGFWEKLMVTFFIYLFITRFRPWQAANPKSRAYVGIGAFNLVRAETFRRLGGYERIAMDVLDDVKLGKMMKREGGRQRFLRGEDLIRVRWIEGMRGMVHGLAKNSYAGFAYNPLLTLGAVTGLLTVNIWPILGVVLALAGVIGPWPGVVCGATVLAMVLAVQVTAPGETVHWSMALCFPVASVILVYIMLRSMVLTEKNRGIRWRGTHYRLRELRKALY